MRRPGYRMRRPGQPEVLAQRAAGVLGAEEAAPLKNRHHAIDEVLQAVRQRVRHQVEVVGRTALEPVLDVVGDLFGGADDDAVSAAAGECADQFARRAVVAPRERQRGVEERCGCRCRRPARAVGWAGAGRASVGRVRGLHDFGEFGRAGIAPGMVRCGFQAEVSGRGHIGRGHDVPAGAAPAHVVEGREAARDVVGLVVARRRAADQPDCASSPRRCSRAARSARAPLSAGSGAGRRWPRCRRETPHRACRPRRSARSGCSAAHPRRPTGRSRAGATRMAESPSAGG